MFTDIVLAFHFIGLMLGAGGGFGTMIVMRVAAARPPEEMAVFRSLAPVMVRVASIGLVLMLASGLTLALVRYGGFADLPALFWVKMLFVTSLTAASILIEVTHAQIKAGHVAAAARLPRLGPIAGISSILAVVLAVLAFH